MSEIAIIRILLKSTFKLPSFFTTRKFRPST
jgi:hypothetical protein